MLISSSKNRTPGRRASVWEDIRRRALQAACLRPCPRAPGRGGATGRSVRASDCGRAAPVLPEAAGSRARDGAARTCRRGACARRGAARERTRTWAPANEVTPCGRRGRDGCATRCRSRPRDVSAAGPPQKARVDPEDLEQVPVRVAEVDGAPVGAVVRAL